MPNREPSQVKCILELKLVNNVTFEPSKTYDCFTLKDHYRIGENGKSLSSVSDEQFKKHFTGASFVPPKDVGSRLD
jgi:hypothetical protein